MKKGLKTFFSISDLAATPGTGPSLPMFTELFPHWKVRYPLAGPPTGVSKR